MATAVDAPATVAVPRCKAGRPGFRAAGSVEQVRPFRVAVMEVAALAVHHEAPHDCREALSR